METPSSVDTRKVYAIGIGICAVALLVFALFATIEPTYAAGSFGLETATPSALKSTGSSVPKIIGRIINAALRLVGIVFLVLMIFAGIRWMTARGESKHAETAKDTITRAIIGLIIIAGAYAITSFVLSRVAGSTDTTTGSTESSSSSAPDYGDCVQGKACTAATATADCAENGGCFDNVCSCNAL